MQTLLLIAALLPPVLGGYLALDTLQQVGEWARRRAVQLLALAAPAVGLSLGLIGLWYCMLRAGGADVERWDAALTTALALVLGLVMLAGVGLALLRLVLLARFEAHTAARDDAALSALARSVAAQLGIPCPHVRLCDRDHPLAITYGFRRPRVILSRWMVAELDAQELEAVLAHELAHVARRDTATTWLATLLRDAFWYLPTSRRLHRLLRRDQELACDDLALTATQRPLALASALAKVWYCLTVGPRFALVQHLAGKGDQFEERITRLLTSPTPRARALPTVMVGPGRAALLGLLAFELLAFTMLLVPGSCDPTALIGRLC